MRAALPPGWISADIGGAQPAGSSDYSEANSTFAVTGGGNLINRAANSPDKFQYVWREVSGNFVATAKIESISSVMATPGQSPAPRAGLMLRKSASPTAAYALAGGEGTVSGTGRSVDYWRARDGDQFLEHMHYNGLPLPYWVRISRFGDKVHSELSTDGINWATNYGVVMDDLPETVLIGLAAASRDTGATTTAVFSHLSVTPLTLTHQTSWLGNSIGGTYWGAHVIDAVLDLTIDPVKNVLACGRAG